VVTSEIKLETRLKQNNFTETKHRFAFGLFQFYFSFILDVTTSLEIEPECPSHSLPFPVVYSYSHTRSQAHPYLFPFSYQFHRLFQFRSTASPVLLVSHRTCCCLGSGGLRFYRDSTIFFFCLAPFCARYPPSSLNGTQQKSVTCSEVSAI